MKNRTAAVIITIVAILFCACPGLAFLCFGFTGFFDYYAFQSYVFGITDKTTADIWGITGICLGICFILFAVIVSFFVLRKNKDTSQNSNEPIPPTI
jgi:choline-glycine betaine transporter